MKEYKCYYGCADMKKSSLEEYKECERSDRRITHINHPLSIKSDPKKHLLNIWLKTHGLKSFVIQCNSKDLQDIIKELDLQKE